MSTQEQSEIYLITNQVNMKCYVGQAKCIISGRPYGARQRWNAHRRHARANDQQCMALENAIRKYGQENFTMVIMAVSQNQIEADILETVFISGLKTLSPAGYNIELGGKLSGSKTMSESSKEKLSKARRFKNMSDDDKKRVDDAMTDLKLTEIPRKISFKRRDKRGFEGFIVDLGGTKNRKQFSAQSLSLTEKLNRAIVYLNASKEGPDSLNRIKNENQSREREMSNASAMRRKLIIPEIEEAMKINGIFSIPMYVHWNRQYKYFYYHRRGSQYRAFKTNTPSDGLKLALEFIGSAVVEAKA